MERCEGEVHSCATHLHQLIENMTTERCIHYSQDEVVVRRVF